MRTKFLSLLLMGAMLSCDKEDKHVAVPIAPIILEVTMPTESTNLPNAEAKIQGKGFSGRDIIRLVKQEEILDVDVIAVSDNDITVRVPRQAEGVYRVQVERDNQQSLLLGNFIVPAVVVIDDLVFPSEIVNRESSVRIEGKGFETNDRIVLSNANYGQNIEIPVTTAVDAEGINIQLPAHLYGINRVVVKRERKITVLGELKIAVQVGDVLGGGVVYFTTNSGLNGMIASKANVGTPTEMFGPAVSMSNIAGTSTDMGAGAPNTNKLIQSINQYRLNNPNSNWKNIKTAAELCRELVVKEGDFEFKDWYLPSQDELKELFRQKNLLAQKGAAIPANNYWSSSEGPGDQAGWSAYYVNFYEATNIVSSNSDREGWKIGVRPVRSF